MAPWFLPRWSRLSALFQRRETERAFDAEMQTHLELLAEKFVRQGMQPDEAMSAARRQFGNPVLLQQRQREARTYLCFANLWQDIRFGARILAKSPGVTAIAILSLALGIGANAAIFTLAKAVLLDPLTVPHPEQLRLLSLLKDDRSVVENSWGDFYPDEHGHTVVASFSYPVYQQLRDHDHSLGELWAFVDLGQFGHVSATMDGHAEVLNAELVSGNFFQGLGVTAALGRPIETADDATPGKGAVAVISDSFWQRRFAHSPTVIGKTITVNRTPVTIIGVAPKGFTGASHVQLSQDLFLPLSMQPVLLPREGGSLLANPNIWWIQIMGRMQAGVPEEAARASLQVGLDQATRSTMTVARGRTIPPLFLLPGNRGWNYAAHELERPIPILLALAGLVLLLACANVANLLLARAASRQREMSVRVALGARKARIFAQLLTESWMLAILGGTAGLLLGYLARNLLPRLLSSSWGPTALSTRFDWRVFVFTLAISVLTGFAFGLAPAWQATRTNSSLRDGGANMNRHRKTNLGKALVIFQVSLCMLLLVGAGLFVRTLANLNATDPGFNKQGLLLFAVDPPPQRYPAPKDIAVLHRIEDSIAALPVVASVTLSRETLLAQSISNSDFLPLTQTPNATRDRGALFNSVGQRFFSTMGIPLLYGRSFDLRDTPTSPRVAIISQSLARREFAGGNPIGKMFRMEEGELPFEIVGVCADAKYGWLRGDPSPTFYILYEQQQNARRGMTFEVRTKGNPVEAVTAIRGAIDSFDNDLPMIEVRTQEDQVNATLAPERSFATVTTGFGLLALVLASIGVYGVMVSTVARRVNEIGVRMALGAQARQVLYMIVSETARLAAAGIGAGLLAALLLSRFLSSMLFGLKPNDPLTLAAAALLLFAIALLAGWGPARKASRIQPVQALRHE
jgi:predicted permease